MSLDVYLEVPVPIKCEPGSGIFIREEGQTKEISREEWDQRNPSREPIVFKRDDTETNEVYHGNITHNLGRMAIEAGLYAVLWEPETRGWVLAKDLIASLERGLARLRLNPSDSNASIRKMAGVIMSFWCALQRNTLRLAVSGPTQ